MLQLHFVFATHEGSHTPMALWEKLHELHERGIQPRFVGVESSSALKKYGQVDRLRFDEIRTKLHDARQLLGKPRKPFPVGADIISRQAAKVVGSYFKGTSENMQHWSGLAAIAGSYGVPIRPIEPKRMPEFIRLQKAQSKALQRIMAVFNTFTEKDRNGKWAEEFFLTTGSNIRRHAAVVKELAKQARKLSQTEDHHIVLVFGGNHQGMEQYVDRELKKANVQARIESKTNPPQEPIDALASRRYADPSFIPSVDEITRARKAA